MKPELRQGIVRHVTMRAENARRAWWSVAYFSLDGQPARLECEPLPPFSRSPLPAPFAAGDPLVIVGKMNRAEGRVDVLCARLVRQGRTIDASMGRATIFGGLMMIVMATIFMLPVALNGMNGKSGKLMMACIVLLPLGVFLLLAGFGRLKLRHLVEATRHDG